MQELFVKLGRAMDKELDEIVPTLLKRAGEVSNAGGEVCGGAGGGIGCSYSTGWGRFPTQVWGYGGGGVIGFCY